jgi:hypothetical protein
MLEFRAMLHDPCAPLSLVGCSSVLYAMPHALCVFISSSTRGYFIGAFIVVNIVNYCNRKHEKPVFQ